VLHSASALAVGTHSHAGLKFLGVVPYGSASTNEQAFAHCAGIPTSDILMSEWSGQLHMPGFVLSVDRACKSIVLAFRGTLWPQDWVTDLDCIPRACSLCGHSGFAHSGMLTAAEQAASKLGPMVVRLLGMENYRDYNLFLTGHSLGAGVAALVTAIWLGPHSPFDNASTRLHCVGFGMPAIASPSFASVFKDRITAVICENDIVPRLSLGSCVRLRDLVLQLWESRQWTDASVVERQKEATAYLERLRKEQSKYADDHLLCPLGTVLWVPPSGNRVVQVADAGEAFKEIKLVGNIFQTHLPQNYSDRIASL